MQFNAPKVSQKRKDAQLFRGMVADICRAKGIGSPKKRGPIPQKILKLVGVNTEKGNKVRKPRKDKHRHHAYPNSRAYTPETSHRDQVGVCEKGII